MRYFNTTSKTKRSEISDRSDDLQKARDELIDQRDAMGFFGVTDTNKLADAMDRMTSMIKRDVVNAVKQSPESKVTILGFELPITVGNFKKRLRNLLGLSNRPDAPKPVAEKDETGNIPNP